MILADTLSGSELVIYYRIPTTTERQSYMDGREYRDESGDLIDNLAANRVEHGLAILSGLGEGDFEEEVGKDKYKIVSSEKSSKYYKEDWKDWMETICSDILSVLAIRVFEMSIFPGGAGKQKKNKKTKAKKAKVDQD